MIPHDQLFKELLAAEVAAQIDFASVRFLEGTFTYLPEGDTITEVFETPA